MCPSLSRCVDSDQPRQAALPLGARPSPTTGPAGCSPTVSRVDDCNAGCCDGDGSSEDELCVEQDTKQPPSARVDAPVSLEVKACRDACCGSEAEEEQEEEQGYRDGCCGGSAEDQCDDESDDDRQESCCGGGNVGESPPRTLKACQRPDDSDTEESETKEKDTLCGCCVAILLRYPDSVGLSLQESIASARLPEALSFTPESSVETIIDGVRKRLRTCCRIFRSACVGKDCCYVSTGVTGRPAQRSSPRPGPSVSRTDAQSSTKVDAGRHESLTLEIGGMDCVDCLPKVGKALSRLPSVHVLGLDYLSGLATLTFDPSILSPDAIARFVARATGFQVQPVNGDGPRSSSSINLPVKFTVPPPPHVLEFFNARHRPELGGFEELSIPLSSGDGPAQRRPRDVLKDLDPYGPTLLPATAVEDSTDRATEDTKRIALRTAACCVLSVPVLVFAWADLPDHPLAYGITSVVLCTLIQLLGAPIVTSSVRSLVYLHEADMGLLVAVSTLTAYVFSVVAFALDLSGHRFAEPFFETPALLISLIYVGRLVQAFSRRSAGSTVRALRSLQSTMVLLVEKGEGGVTTESTVDARLLYYGDVVRVQPESRIPTDGIVVDGASEVDESSATGESLPALKSVSSPTLAGTLNLNGTIDVLVTKLVHENSLAQITSLVAQAQASKSRFQEFADRVSSRILPIAGVAAIISFLVWTLVNRFVRKWSVSASGVKALEYGLSVMIVSCPCAIGLAVPLVVAAAMRVGLREGVLFRSSEALQTAGSVDVVAFDKTGTLSQGLFSLVKGDFLVGEVEGLVGWLVASSNHPISKAIAAHIQSLKHLSPTPDSATAVSVPGRGIKATVAGFPLLGGSPAFTGTLDAAPVQELLSRGLTLFTVTLGGELLAVFGLADVARPESAALVRDLVARNKRVVILSGDNLAAVQRLAHSIGLEDQDVRASCSPADKATFIADLQRQGKCVSFCGDGTNDAPALAQADLSLSIGSGSDVAAAASSAILTGTADLRRGVTGALDLAVQARQHIFVALAWCCMYFLFAILLASGAFVKWSIQPQWAGLGEVVSVVPVVVVGFGLEVRWRISQRTSAR